MFGISCRKYPPVCTIYLFQNVTESELETELGITNTLHRLKLRLAIHEIVSLTCITKHHRTVRNGRIGNGRHVGRLGNGHQLRMFCLAGTILIFM